MKLITWNCNMAYRKKAFLLSEYKPDIVVVQECEHPDKQLMADNPVTPASALWFGQNLNKGLGIFSYSDWKLEALDTLNDSFRTIVPVAVTRGKSRFTLFAVWANNPNDREGPYITQVWKALHHYKHLINPGKTVLIGDFNSNTIWDKPRREGNHSTVVQRLKEKGISSVYHKHFKQKQGLEAHPTFYLYRHLEKPYHLDYCFASKDLMRRLQLVEVGDHAFWCRFSDHVPVMVTFDL
ncbi:MAG TPA: endonuclease/exonuclease/phosphatase family protein [Flavisolibacter sp.]|jgi:exonuclease III|nr:endonuclease/exonuclease/phosphatase family protein [Flavisolibacter sp.]